MPDSTRRDIEKGFDSIWHDRRSNLQIKLLWCSLVSPKSDPIICDRSKVSSRDKWNSFELKKDPDRCPSLLYSIFIAELKMPRNYEMAFYTNDNGQNNNSINNF